jgi:hydroxypyruvate isomerase
MKRRSFIQYGTVSTAALLTGSNAWASASKSTAARTLPPKQDFKLKYAPHFGMFKHHAGEDLLDQVQFMADAGFTAMEDNGMKRREIAMQEKIASKMANLGMEMGVFVAHSIDWKEATLVTGDPDKIASFLSQIKESVEVAKRVNARWMTVVPGHVDLQKDLGYQTRNVIDVLKQACEIFEPHNLTMVLEPLNFRDHPGLFLNKIPQAYQICQAVGSSSCKILDDLYHQQIHEGNLIPNIDLAWEEIGYFQVGDNPGRKEPTTGEINYLNVFKHIHDKGFTGIVGMEHGISQPGKEGEAALIEAYAAVDNFAAD